MKSGKAPDVDSIQTEMLKADLITATRVLTNLFDIIWDKETIPIEWDKGLIIMIPKKGNLQVYNYWRGITLLSIPSNVFCRIFLEERQLSIRAETRTNGIPEEKRVH